MSQVSPNPYPGEAYNFATQSLERLMTISIISALWAFVPHEDWYESWHLLCKAVLGHS